MLRPAITARARAQCSRGQDASAKLSSTMNVLLLTLALTSAVCLLHANAQEFEPSRQLPVVLRDTCLPEERIGEHAADEGSIVGDLGGIASTLVGGRASCLGYIYLLAYTSGEYNADSPHPHNIEVVALNETRLIVLPDREGDYVLHRGDIWKLNIIDDLGFPAGSCIRLCNIESVTLVEGGTDGWLIDSVVSFACVSGGKCTQITQDIDANRWVDGDSSTAGRDRFPLTKVYNSPCTF